MDIHCTVHDWPLKCFWNRTTDELDISTGDYESIRWWVGTKAIRQQRSFKSFVKGAQVVVLWRKKKCMYVCNRILYHLKPKKKKKIRNGNKNRDERMKATLLVVSAFFFQFLIIFFYYDLILKTVMAPLCIIINIFVFLPETGRVLFQDVTGSQVARSATRTT